MTPETLQELSTAYAAEKFAQTPAVTLNEYWVNLIAEAVRYGYGLAQITPTQ